MKITKKKRWRFMYKSTSGSVKMDVVRPMVFYISNVAFL